MDVWGIERACARIASTLSVWSSLGAQNPGHWDWDLSNLTGQPSTVSDCLYMGNHPRMANTQNGNVHPWFLDVHARKERNVGGTKKCCQSNHVVWNIQAGLIEPCPTPRDPHLNWVGMEFKVHRSKCASRYYLLLLLSNICIEKIQTFTRLSETYQLTIYNWSG